MPVWISTAILVTILAIPAARATRDDDSDITLALQLSHRLTPPSSAVEPNETERALLRIEWRSRQSKVDEAMAIDAMRHRLDDLGTSVSAVRDQLIAIPVAPAFVPLPTITPEQEIEQPASAPAADTADLPGLLPAAALAALVAATFLFLRVRRRPAPVTFIEDTTFEPLIVAPRSAMPSITPTTTVLDDADELGGTLPDGTDDTTLEVLRNEEIPLELADILISMDLVDGAVGALEQHIREHPRQALVHWLKLLDLYRQIRRQADFEKAAAELNQQFNVATIEWDRREFAPAPSIENYPHIRSRLQHLWRRRACADYLSQLIEDNRDGTRIGFPQPVIEEILLLLAILRR